MIEIKNLNKSYGDLNVLKDFSLSIKKGEITCVLGESGSGKSTLLNCIANLTEYSGEISKVRCSYVFQKPNLFPNLTVKQNLMLVNNSTKKVEETLEFLDILDKQDSYPKHLSGGQLQRVSLARGLLFDSDLILLDEPFSSLDIGLKMSLIDKVKDYQKQNNCTMLMVTHDIKEAVNLANRIIILSKGKIVFETTSINKATEQKLLKILISLGEKIN